MKLSSANYSSGAINAGLLILRLGMGLLLIPHGLHKIIAFDMYKAQFINFMGIGQAASVGLSAFAEFFCAILVVFGLFTRFACIPLVINFIVAAFIGNGGDIIFWMADGKMKGTGEHPLMYAITFLALLIMGPGRYSADAMFKR
jgi:putative oxidoreductase